VEFVTDISPCARAAPPLSLRRPTKGGVMFEQFLDAIPMQMRLVVSLVH